MSDIRWCPRCQRNVDVSPWNGTSIAILIILLVLGGIILGVIYLIYKLVKTKKCPNCGTLEMDLQPPRYGQQPSAATAPPAAGGPAGGTNTGSDLNTGGASGASSPKFCPNCSSSVEPDEVYCHNCGHKLR